MNKTIKEKFAHDLTIEEICEVNYALRNYGEERGLTNICNEDNAWGDTVEKILEKASLVGLTTTVLTLGFDYDGEPSSTYEHAKVIENHRGDLTLLFEDGSTHIFNIRDCGNGFS